MMDLFTITFTLYIIFIGNVQYLQPTGPPNPPSNPLINPQKTPILHFLHSLYPAPAESPLDTLSTIVAEKLRLGDTLELSISVGEKKVHYILSLVMRYLKQREKKMEKEVEELQKGGVGVRRVRGVGIQEM